MTMNSIGAKSVLLHTFLLPGIALFCCGLRGLVLRLGQARCEARAFSLRRSLLLPPTATDQLQ